MVEVVDGGAYTMPNGIRVQACATDLVGVVLELRSAGSWARWAVLTGGAIVGIHAVTGRAKTATCQLTGWSVADLAPA